MKRVALLLALLPVLLVLAPAHAGDSTQNLVDCMRANVPPTLRVQQIELSTSDQTGNTRTLKGRLFAISEKNPAGAGNLLRAMVHIDSPSDLAGASYLVRESADYLKDGMYVYLPSVRRVRRIKGEIADGALLGTNFSYYDFKELQNVFGDSVATAESHESVDGRDTQVLLFKPKEGVKSRYSSVRAWVDEKTCVPLKASFYEGSGVRKELNGSASALQQSGKFWYLADVEMKDVKDGSTTRLHILKLVSGKELPSRYFDPNSFYLAE